MAEGILGLGSGQASTLNQELIDKLKEAERDATVKPLETDLEEWDTEKEKITEIIAKANEFLETIKPFDLYVSGGVNAFDRKAATTSGDSVVFNAVDEASLNTGTTNVTINTLAQRDVYQTETFADASTVLSNGTLTIAHDGTNYDFTTDGKTYQELADEINLNSNINATVETVGTNQFRIVIKSEASGLDNALTISHTGGALDTELGDLSAVSANHTVTASNMKATVDGVDYNVSTNTIVVDGGLEIAAVKTGDSSISVEKSTTNVQPSMQEMVDKYNELVTMVDAELYSAESPMEDKATLRTMMSGIKDTLFGSYGASDDKNIFIIGFELDENGYMSLDATVFNEAMSNDPEGIRELFIGVAEDEGLGTRLKTYVDSLDSFDGLLTSYENNMDTRKESLNEEKDKAVTALDNKYAQLAQQFAAYAGIITQFESSFSGLQMIIQQSTASN